MPAEVGTAYVAIMPSARGFGTHLRREVEPESRRAGRESGEHFGGEFAKRAGALMGAAAIFEFLKDATKEASAAIRVQKLTAQVVKTTGGAAHVTAGQVEELSLALAKQTGVDRVAIQNSENLLLTFTNVRNEVGKGNDVFDRATGLVQDMSVALKQDAKNGAIQLGKALNDPIKGLTALSRVGVSFSADQKKLIKGFVANNDVLSAQKVILAELDKEFGGAAAAQVTAGDKLKVSWSELKETIGKVILPAVGLLATALQKVVDLGTEWFKGPEWKEAVKWFKAELLPVLEHIAKVLKDTVVKAFKSVVTVVNTYFMPGLRGMFEFVKTNAGWAAPLIIGIGLVYKGWKILTLLMATNPFVLALLAIAALWTAIDPLQSTLNDTASFLKGEFTTVVGKLKELVTNSIGPALVSLVTSIGKVIVKLGPALAAIITAFGDVVTFFSNVVIPAFGSVFDFIKNHANWAGPILLGIGAIIVAWKLLTIAIATNPVGLLLIGLVAIGTLIMDHWTDFKRNSLELWDGIKTGVIAAWTVIKDVFTTIFGSIVNAFMTLWTGIKWIWDNLLTPFFVTFPVTLGGWFAGAATWLWNAGKSILGGLWTGITWVWTNVIVGFFLSFPAKLGGWFAAAGSWLWNSGYAIIKGLFTGIVGFFAAVVGWFLRLPGRIVDFFVNAAKWLWNAGKALIQGLVEGMIDALAEPLKVLGPVGDAFKEGLKIVFGIKSPAKSMIPIGMALAQGIFKGLAAENPIAVATKVFGGMPQALKALFAAGKFSAADIMGITNPKYKGLIGSILGGLGAGAGGLGGVFTGGYSGGGDLAGWLTRAIAITGVPMSWLAPLESLAMHESGGNPNAINNYDINAQRGDPSRGLLQTIMSTFQAYRDPSLPDNIYDPVANAVAAIRYMIARYGSIFQIASYTPSGFVGGYAEGTNYVPRTGLALVHQGEAIIPKAYNQTITTGATASAGGLDYGRTVEAFREAMRGMRVELDGQLMGRVQAAYSTRLARR